MPKYSVTITFLFLLVKNFAFAQGEPHQFSRLNVDNGLSHNRVTCIYKDSKGFMWFGTKSGLNRYDGYKFKVFKHDLNDPASISDNYIISISKGPENKLWIKTGNGFNVYDPLTDRFGHCIKKILKQYSIPDSLIVNVKEDKAGNFWFLHSKQGIYKYTPNRQIKHLIHQKNDTASLYAGAAMDISHDGKGNAWVIYSDGVLEKIDYQTNKVTKRVYAIKKAYPNESIEYHITVDGQNDVWVFAPLRSNGAFFVSDSKNEYKHLGKDIGSISISSNIVYDIVDDNKGLIWIGTDHGGVNLIDKKTFFARQIMNRPDDNRSLSQNCIISMYKDNAGIIWIGTFKKGISYHHKDIIKFPLYRRHSFDNNSLSYEDINRFLEDKQGNLWIGSNGGGLIYYNRHTGKFTTYTHNEADPNSLSTNVVASLHLDHDGKLWLGTYFGGLECFDGKKFTHYKRSLTNTNSLSDNSVWEIMEDSQNRLWIGTLSGGLNLYDRKKKTFRRFLPGRPNSVPHQYVSGLLEDSKKNIWVATYSGLAVLPYNSPNFIYYKHDEEDKQSLINDKVSNLMMDSRKLIWIATNEGLSMFNPATGKFKNFLQVDGIPDNSVLSVLEDDDHNLWLSTPNGLSNMIITPTKKGGFTYEFKNYDQTDGLQGKEFNEDAALKTRNGDLIFGGANGFNLFKPQSIKSAHEKPVLVLTDFQLFNKSLRTGEDINGHAVLSKSITETRQVTLKHNENVFSIEFAAVNFFNPAKMKHAYMLEGFDKGWILADNSIRKASYTNLDPGSYTFRLKVAGEDGKWKHEEIALKITVLPPIWRTTWAYITYFLMVCSMLLYIRYRGIKKLKSNFAIERERQEAQRMHELDLMKIKFFTNVSHEFRTPLALILAPVDKLLKTHTETDLRQQLQMINRNARRLLNMVNQLLDFRKMEVNELKLHNSRSDIIGFIEEAASSFTDIAENKKIKLCFSTQVETLITNFDHDKLERILFNLLSNAFKFTLEEGKVEVKLSLIENSGNKFSLQISVIDSGIGISEKKLEKIFDRFFQNDVPGTMVNQGSGIGLAITREFVHLHNGTITVQSTINKGSCFTITLPVTTEHVLIDSNKNILINHERFPSSGSGDGIAGSGNQRKVQSKKPVVLLIEDNDDFRFYLKDNLKDRYNIVEAVNGKDGWQKVLSTHPNLIVSDISMPEMNGIDLCRKIKQDSRTTHIPVILLTALEGKDDQLKGLETGASDYLTKPFSFEILLSKIKNLLNQQITLKKTYQKQLDINAAISSMEPHDEKFMKDILKFIEKRIADPDFSVEELSSEMAMSRVTLYRRILVMTERTPVEFIKFIRIQRSANLIETTHLNIAEIAYQVGFNNPKYFAKSFKAEYGILPTEYRANALRNKNGAVLTE